MINTLKKKNHNEFMKLSIIIPLFNEKNTIVKLLDKIEETNLYQKTNNNC